MTVSVRTDEQERQPWGVFGLSDEERMGSTEILGSLLHFGLASVLYKSLLYTYIAKTKRYKVYVCLDLLVLRSACPLQIQGEDGLPPSRSVVAGVTTTTLSLTDSSNLISLAASPNVRLLRTGKRQKGDLLNCRNSLALSRLTNLVYLVYCFDSLSRPSMSLVGNGV